MSNRRFIIDVDGVYYMTHGPLLVYDPNDTKGSKQVADGIAEVKRKFEAASKAASYTAVEVDDANFAATISADS